MYTKQEHPAGLIVMGTIVPPRPARTERNRLGKKNEPRTKSNRTEQIKLEQNRTEPNRTDDYHIAIKSVQTSETRTSSPPPHPATVFVLPPTTAPTPPSRLAGSDLHPHHRCY